MGPGTGVDGEYIDRHCFQFRIIEHHVGQHVTTYCAATPANKIDASGDNAVLAEQLDDLLL